METTSATPHPSSHGSGWFARPRSGNDEDSRSPAGTKRVGGEDAGEGESGRDPIREKPSSRASGLDWARRVGKSPWKPRDYSMRVPSIRKTSAIHVLPPSVDQSSFHLKEFSFISKKVTRESPAFPEGDVLLPVITNWPSW